MAHYLISRAYLIDKTVIDNNTEQKLINPIIELVQMKYVKRLLGTNLYDLLITESQATLSAANSTLLNDYVLPAMRWWIEAEAVWTFRFRYMNKGIMVKSSENSQPISEAEAKNVYDYKMGIAQLYAKECKEYIRANEGDFPTYFTNTDIGDVVPDNSTFECPIYLPDIDYNDGEN